MTKSFTGNKAILAANRRLAPREEVWETRIVENGKTETVSGTQGKLYSSGHGRTRSFKIKMRFSVTVELVTLPITGSFGLEMQ